MISASVLQVRFDLLQPQRSKGTAAEQQINPMCQTLYDTMFSRTFGGQNISLFVGAGGHHRLLMSVSFWGHFKPQLFLFLTLLLFSLSSLSFFSFFLLFVAHEKKNLWIMITLSSSLFCFNYSLSLPSPSSCSFYSSLSLALSFSTPFLLFPSCLKMFQFSCHKLCSPAQLSKQGCVFSLCTRYTTKRVREKDRTERGKKEGKEREGVREGERKRKNGGGVL